MYFWNVKGLKRDLGQGPLAPAAALQYLIAWCVSQGLGYIVNKGPSTDSDADPTQGWLHFLVGLVYLAITLVGLNRCYGINGGPRGKHFLDRVVSLSWVMTIRFFPLFLVGLVVWVVILKAVHVEVTSLTVLPLSLGIVVAWWWRLEHHLHDVVMAAGASPTAFADPVGVQ